MGFHDQPRQNMGRGNPRPDYRTRQPNPPIEPKALPSNYVDAAEDIMRDSAQDITTSKLRRLYSLITDIYNTESLRNEPTLSSDSVAAIAMARIRFAYECGRDAKVGSFVQKANLIAYLKGIGTNRSAFTAFAQYMEALIAFHKFYNGREN